MTTSKRCELICFFVDGGEYKTHWLRAGDSAAGRPRGPIRYACCTRETATHPSASRYGLVVTTDVDCAGNATGFQRRERPNGSRRNHADSDVTGNCFAQRQRVRILLACTGAKRCICDRPESSLILTIFRPLNAEYRPKGAYGHALASSGRMARPSRVCLRCSPRLSQPPAFRPR